MTEEGRIQREIQLAASELGARLFRRHVGTFYSGTPERQRDGTTILRNARPVKIGVEGEPDLGGFMPVLITEAHVGQTLPVAAIVEVKTPKGRVSPKQVAYIQVARRFGLLAGVARSVEDVARILAGEELLR